MWSNGYESKAVVQRSSVEKMFLKNAKSIGKHLWLLKCCKNTFLYSIKINQNILVFKKFLYPTGFFLSILKKQASH